MLGKKENGRQGLIKKGNHLLKCMEEKEFRIS